MYHLLTLADIRQTEFGLLKHTLWTILLVFMVLLDSNFVPPPQTAMVTHLNLTDTFQKNHTAILQKWHPLCKTQKIVS